jgi:5'-3' exonuclease|tara:strand:- start:2114 stop:2956 length:843 start_codon:yes stop_codon:yes gene_type:complete
MTKSWNDLADLQEPDYSTYNNLMIVDANNLSYRWLQRPNYASFDADFIRTIQSLSKSYEATRTIVCFDFGKSYYRMDLHEEYKGTRKKPQDEDEIKKYEDFFAVLNALPDQLDDEILKFRGVEADDILAWITQNISDQYDHTWIVSSDRDLYQLIDENISIFNIFGRKEVTTQTLLEDFEVTPSEYMLSRIIEGDKSDNILGIEGIGPKRAQSLAREYKTLDSILEALPIKGRSKYIQNLNAGREQLIRNEKLINLKQYCVDAICAGKEGDKPLERLNSL